jgi:hypothetical protein
MAEPGPCDEVFPVNAPKVDSAAPPPPLDHAGWGAASPSIFLVPGKLEVAGLTVTS